MCSAICWAHFHYCKEHCENKRLRKEDVVKDQECKDCSFFPVCYGGCAAYKNKICSSVKWNAEEMLELMKEMAQ